MEVNFKNYHASYFEVRNLTFNGGEPQVVIASTTIHQIRIPFVASERADLRRGRGEDYTFLRGP